MNLLDYKQNTYSQGGEDGIIEKIISMLPNVNKWCVEFGAWDGIYLSNTYNIIEKHDYAAVLIEANKARFLELRKNNIHREKVIVFNKLVGLEKSNGLDSILSETPIPKDFDLLSIDIDGNDFHVWDALTQYRPKLVCIEYNPTIPTEVDFIQPANGRISQGSSLSALVNLGKQKGYELIAVTVCNAIFIQSQYFPLFNIQNNSPEKLRKDISCVSYIFTGYDGSILIKGSGKMIWHDIALKKRIRKLPKIFRDYPGNYGKLKRFLFNKIYGGR